MLKNRAFPFKAWSEPKPGRYQCSTCGMWFIKDSMSKRFDIEAGGYCKDCAPPVRPYGKNGKFCGTCCGLSHRVKGKTCRECGLPFKDLPRLTIHEVAAGRKTDD